MKDYFNPSLLLVIVALLACFPSGGDVMSSVDAWGLVLCVTAFVVNASLGVARAMTRQRSLMCVVWSVVYLILGSCVWVMSGQETAPDEELLELRQLEADVQQGRSPFAVDENGDCLFIVAASLGKERLVKNLLTAGERPPALLVSEGARRAAENDRVAVLRLLLGAGVEVNAPVAGTTLLCSAAQNGRIDSTKLLLKVGADVNMPDAEGTPPLIHAVIADAAPLVNILMRAGANVSLKDAAGRDAASYSRSDKVDAALMVKPDVD